MSPFASLRRLLRTLPGLSLLVTGIIMTCLLSVAATYRGYLLKTLVDSVITRDKSGFLTVTVLILAVQLGRGFILLVRTFVVGKYAEQGARFLRESAFGRVGRASLSTLDGIHSGEVLSRLSNDLERVSAFLTNHAVDLVYMPLTAVLAFAYLCSVSMKMTLVMSASIPVLLGIGSLSTRPMSRLSKDTQQALAQMNAIVRDGISGAELIKAYGSESVVVGRFNETITNWLKKTKGL